MVGCIFRLLSLIFCFLVNFFVVLLGLLFLKVVFVGGFLIILIWFGCLIGKLLMIIVKCLGVVYILIVLFVKYVFVRVLGISFCYCCIVCEIKVVGNFFVLIFNKNVVIIKILRYLDIID